MTLQCTLTAATQANLGSSVNESDHISQPTITTRCQDKCKEDMHWLHRPESPDHLADLVSSHSCEDM
jgi:hypothetical protein